MEIQKFLFFYCFAAGAKEFFIAVDKFNHLDLIILVIPIPNTLSFVCFPLMLAIFLQCVMFAVPWISKCSIPTTSNRI
jgi:hypothetical protein